jgi:hypothetical protein
MNHEKAAGLRDDLNRSRHVESPDDSAGSHPFRLARVNQPGYLNGEPMYEVVPRITESDGFMLPSNLLRDIVDEECYLRVECVIQGFSSGSSLPRAAQYR